MNEHWLPQAHQWREIFLPHLSWGEKTIRPLVVYLLLLGAFRWSGKRELGQTTLFDLLILLLISNVVQNAIIGDDNSIFGALAGVVTLLVLTAVLNRVTAQSKRARQILEGSPALLVYEGKVLEDRMRKETVSVNDLFSALREEGIASLSEVRYAILELNGKISIIKTDAALPEDNDNCVTQEIREQAHLS